jgi:hypothetical protein
MSDQKKTKKRGQKGETESPAPKVADKEKEKCICGACNKQYSSYPALYTHVKNKHEGVMPEGSKYPSTSKNNDSNGKTKSGRPPTFRQPTKKAKEEEDLDRKFTFHNDLYVWLGFIGEDNSQANAVYADELQTEDNHPIRKYPETAPLTKVGEVIRKKEIVLKTLEQLILENSLDCNDELGDLFVKAEVKREDPTSFHAYLGCILSWLSEKLKSNFYKELALTLEILAAAVTDFNQFQFLTHEQILEGMRSVISANPECAPRLVNFQTFLKREGTKLSGMNQENVEKLLFHLDRIAGRYEFISKTKSDVKACE